MYKLYYINCYINKEIDCPTTDTIWNYVDIRNAFKSAENRVFVLITRPLKNPINYDYIFMMLEHSNTSKLLFYLLELNIEEFVNELLNSEDSLIRNEILNSNLNLDSEKKYIIKYVYYILSQECLQQNGTIKITKERLEPFKNFFISFKYETIKSNLVNIESMVVHLTSFFLDIYSYYRMLKNALNKNKNSNINICVFGESHVNFYSYFLSTIVNKYNVIHTVKSVSTKNFQCLDLSGMFFDVDLYAYKKIEKYNIYNSRYTILKLFREYFLSQNTNDFLKSINEQYDKEELESLLQKDLEYINGKNSNLSLTINELKNIIKYDLMVNEYILNNKLENKTDEKDITDELLLYANTNSLDICIKNKYFIIANKILDNIQNTKLEVSEYCIETYIQKYNIKDDINPFIKMFKNFPYKFSNKNMFNNIPFKSPLYKYIKSNNILTDKRVLY